MQPAPLYGSQDLNIRVGLSTCAWSEFMHLQWLLSCCKYAKHSNYFFSTNICLALVGYRYALWYFPSSSSGWLVTLGHPPWLCFLSPPPCGCQVRRETEIYFSLSVFLQFFMLLSHLHNPFPAQLPWLSPDRATAKSLCISIRFLTDLCRFQPVVFFPMKPSAAGKIQLLRHSWFHKSHSAAISVYFSTFFPCRAGTFCSDEPCFKAKCQSHLY